MVPPAHWPDRFKNLPEEVEGMELETEEIPVGPPIDQSINESKIDTDFGPPKRCSIYFMIQFLFIHWIKKNILSTNIYPVSELERLLFVIVFFWDVWISKTGDVRDLVPSKWRDGHGGWGYEIYSQFGAYLADILPNLPYGSPNGHIWSNFLKAGGPNYTC